MNTSQATHHDAELILKLYDMRREPVMREARHFIFSFNPQSIDDVMAIASDFSLKENAYFRQVVGYWDMAASLVLRGALNKELALDNFTEMLAVYSRLEPFLPELRKRMGLDFLAQHIEQYVAGSPEAQARVKGFQKRFAERQQATAGAR